PYSTTGIGSLPHTLTSEACDLIFKSVDIPFWPQLPRLSFKESMIIQFSEGMPFLRINEEEKSVTIIRDSSDELERFYEAYNENTKIAISEDYAKGLHRFLKIIRSRRLNFLKGHITGPITYTLSLKDGSGRYIYFDEELREVAHMLLKAKVRWQLEVFKPCCENVIIFIDEPILSAIGSSSYIGVDSNEILRLLMELVATIKQNGGIAGIHCCGRFDFPLVIKSGVDIISFDAYDYSDLLLIYHAEIKEFLERGNYLAWGIVPTTEIIQHLEEKNIISLLSNAMKILYKEVSPQLVNSQILLTPSCGTASRTVGESIRVFQLLMRLKEAFTGFC
ncbi:MAG: hypothetical protein N2511_06025, partial [Thermodesulfovibrionales bacterium]|nr:hypothetical protein [Thermodesulfovibrionales bacterium]